MFSLTSGLVVGTLVLWYKPQNILSDITRFQIGDLITDKSFIVFLIALVSVLLALVGLMIRRRVVQAAAKLFPARDLRAILVATDELITRAFKS
jgi:hypothetical protein